MKLVSSNRWLAMTKQNNFYLQQGELFCSLHVYWIIGSKIVGKVDLKKLRENLLGWDGVVEPVSIVFTSFGYTSFMALPRIGQLWQFTSIIWLTNILNIWNPPTLQLLMFWHLTFRFSGRGWGSGYRLSPSFYCHFPLNLYFFACSLFSFVHTDWEPGVIG